MDFQRSYTDKFNVASYINNEKKCLNYIWILKYAPLALGHTKIKIALPNTCTDRHTQNGTNILPYREQGKQVKWQGKQEYYDKFDATIVTLLEQLDIPLLHARFNEQRLWCYK